MDFIKKLIKNNLDIILFTVLMFIKLISVNATIKLGIVSNLTATGCLGSVLVVAGISSFFSRKIRIPLLFIFNIIITSIVYIDNVYNRYFLDVTTIGLVNQLGLAGEVSGSIFALITVKDLLYIVDIVFFLILYIYIRKRNKLRETNTKIKTKPLKRVVYSLPVIIIGFVLCSFSTKGLAKSQPGILDSFYDKKEIVKQIGVLNYHILDINKYLRSHVLKKESINEEEKVEVKEFFEDKNKKDSKNLKYNGIAKDKNLIVIQLEAFQSFVLNKKINGVEITPNLNKLAKESLNFNNYYFQTSIGGTSDAEFLTNNSLLPAKDSAVYYQYAGNTFNSLPKLLKERDYYTSVAHANRPGFWNRQEMYKSLGFDVYESDQNYNIDDKIILGLSDKSFFKQNIEKMKSYKKPFYSFMISLTSHYPFVDSENALKDIINVGDLEGTLIGHFIKTAKYTDEALGEFLNDLKKNGMYENSVIAIYGDHSAVSSDKRDQLAKAAYGKDTITDLEWQEAQKVVAMIHIPGSDIKGEINAAAGQYDMYPTLANLYGLDAGYTLGQDILNSDSGFVVTRGGNFFTDDVIYVKSEDKLYSRKTKKELNKDDYKKEFEKMDQYFRMSDKIIENNLLKEFNNK